MSQQDDSTSFSEIIERGIEREIEEGIDRQILTNETSESGHLPESYSLKAKSVEPSPSPSSEQSMQ